MRLTFRKIFTVLLVVAAAAYWYLLIDPRVGDVPDYRIDLDALRHAADSIPGDKPTEVDAEMVAIRRTPTAVLVAGGGLRFTTVGTFAYRLRAPEGDVVINSGVDKQQSDDLHMRAFSPMAYDAVQHWLDEARLVVFTHDYIDRMGGFLSSPDFARIAPKVVLDPAQEPALARTGMLPWPRDISMLAAPVEYTGLHAVAPGVVLIRTPGRTPGSQMVYARLANGREYLFPGDPVPLQESLERLRPNSRLLAKYLVPENRHQTFAWLKAVRRLKDENPSLVVVYSHDASWMWKRETQALIKARQRFPKSLVN